MSKGKLLHIRRGYQTAKAIPTSGLPDNAIHQISFSLEKNSVLHNTHNIVSHRLSICTLKLFLTMKTRFCQMRKPTGSGKLWCSLGFHASQEVSGRSAHAQFPFTKLKCLGCSLAPWSWAECLGLWDLSSYREANVTWWPTSEHRSREL